MSKTLAEIKALDIRRKELVAQLKLERSRKKILCSCKKMHAIKDLVVIQTHWYTEPYGCTGGDYWSEGELQFLCPETEVRNRILFMSKYNSNVRYEDRQKREEAFRREYRDLFKKVEKEYDRYEKRYSHPSFNNDYVDKNWKKFELE